MPKLANLKRERFCREYIIDLNGTQAARRAGYSKTRSTSTRLLDSPGVQERIAELQGKVVKKLDLTAEKVLQEIAKIGFTDIGQFLTFGPGGVRIRNSEDLTVDQLAAVSEVQEFLGTEGRTGIKIKLHDKLSALRDLGKHLKLFTEQVEVKDKSMAQVVSEMRKDRLERERQQAKQTGT